MAYQRVVLPAPEAAASDGQDQPPEFVSRAGHKLQAAILAFQLNISGRTCADLGANVGGFTDCLLRQGAARVYAVDTAYGVLAWPLRKDPRVIVRDRTNALHLRLPEQVTLAAVDVGWTRQEKILPAVSKIIAAPPGIDVLTLIKPHYESDLARSQRGILSAAQSEEVLWQVIERIATMQNENSPGWHIKGIVKSPLEGQKGNIEYVAWLQPAATPAHEASPADNRRSDGQ